MVDLAYAMAQAPSGGGANGGGGILSILPLMVGMFAIMYFIVIRPQQKQKRDRDAMLGAIKKGDRVVTTSGIHGTVTGMDEQTITLRVGDQVKLTFDRAAVGRIVPAQGEKDGSS
jgi:preprotein translocase subunit YajC